MGARGEASFRARLFPIMGLMGRGWASFTGARPDYPGEAPSSTAICRKVSKNGNDCGR